MEKQTSGNQLFDLLPDAVVFLDDKGIIVACNRRASGISGYRTEELIGHNFATLGILAPESLTLVSKLFEKMIAGDKGNPIEIDIICKDGHLITVEANPQMVTREGRPVGLEVVLRDITERKKAEQRLHKMNEGFLDLGIDPDKNIQKLTALCGEMLGAACALYNRLEDGTLYSAGQWNTPSDYEPRSIPDRYICNDVINSAGDDVLIVRNLPESKYAQTNPNILRYGLKTYIGKAVKFGSKNIGSLCVMYLDDIVLGDSEIRLLGMLASAIGGEEERKRVQQEYSKLKLGIERSGEAIFLTDVDGKIVYINPAFEKIYGYSQEEAIGQTPRILKSGSQPPETYRKIWQILFSHNDWRGEFVNRAKDGRLLNIEASINPFLDNSGQTIGYIAIQRDVTERKRSEKQLRVEKAYMEQLIECAPEAVVVAGNDGNIIRVNSEFTRMFGYSPEEAAGKSVDKLLAPGTLLQEAESLTKMSFDQRISCEAIRYRKDGKPIPVSILCAPIDAGEGQIAVYGIYRDITEQKKVEELSCARTDFLSRLVGLTNTSELALLTFEHIGNQMPIDAGIIIIEGDALIGRSYEVVSSFDTDEGGVRKTGVEREYFDIGKDTFSSEVLRSGARQVIHRSEEEYKKAIPNKANLTALNRRRSRSLVFLPLKVHGDTFGVLSVQSYQPDVYNEGRVAILESVAADLALAVTAVRMTDALRESEEKYRIVAEQTGQIIYDYDVKSGKIIWSGAVEAISGYTLEELRAIDIEWWAGLIHPEDRAAALAALDDTMKSGSHYNVEYRLQCKDGHYIYVEDNGVFLSDGSGVAFRMLGTMSDISEHRRAKELLVKSEEKYRKLVETMPNGLAIVDLDENIIFVNPMAAKIFGDSREHLIGRDLKSIVGPGEHSRICEEKEKRKRGEQSEYELSIKRSDGQYRTITIAAAPLYDNENAVVASIAIFNDITDIRNSEAEKLELREKLARAQRMESLGVLAGGVAHDLNNILGPLVAYPELIRMKLSPDSPIIKQITKIESSAQRAAEVVQDLLTMARRGRYEMTALDLNKIVAGYMQSSDFSDLRRRFPLVEVASSLDYGAMPIYGSSPHLYKVVINLALNAMDAMPNGGRLEIKTETRYVDKLVGGYDNIERGMYTILTVSDSGIGIDLKDYRRIFEPFYTKKEMGRSGSGLGLAIVYGVVKDHNGYIDVRSEPNKGSDFILYFPATMDQAESDSPTCSDIRGDEGILVVDDVIEQRELAATVLGSLGYKVYTAANGHEAIDFLKQNTIDVVILDMIMEPGFDGLDTYREITNLHPGQKAIITSGYAETERVKEAEGLGVGKYIRKPYTMQKLGKGIREILGPRAVAALVS